MTRRQTRIFFVAGTTIFALDLHRPDHPQSHEVRRADARGRDHARRHRGQARVAPEELHQLPHAARRGRLLCAGSDQDHPAPRRGLSPAVPSRSVKYYSEERHGRLMPNPKLSDQEITAVIAFLTWISNIDNQNWPPRPILVSAASPQGIVLGTPRAPQRRQIPWHSARRSSTDRRQRVLAATRSSRASRWSALARRLGHADQRPAQERRLQRQREDA